jgi:hypothetical protein
MLIPLVVVCWRTRDDRGKERPQKKELLSYRCVDLELEAQYKDVRRQLNEYDRSREPEVKGKWNKVCSECGYLNHERHRFCESCGCSLTDTTWEVIHLCPKCRTTLNARARECYECGARFWSPIILRRAPEDDRVLEAAEGPDEAP